MTDIVFINQSASVSAGDLSAIVAALQIQINRDFAPVWGTIATLHIATGPEGAWMFYLQDEIDQPNALGYHTDENGLPIARIDIAGSIAAGQDWRTPISHEVLEALADPQCMRMAPNGVDIIEVCDPVEETIYTINGLVVSNFVLPAYFGLNAGAKYDFNGQLTAPAPTLLSGGYIMQLVNNQWTDTKGFMAMRESGRRAWRKKNTTLSAEAN
jgi:hypothetical protein